MVQASEIRDKGTLEAWLNGRPEAVRQREAVILAHRVALRVLPLYLGSLDQPWAREFDLTALPILRVSLTSGAYAGNPTPEVKEAAATRAAALAAARAAATRAATRAAATRAAATRADAAARAADAAAATAAATARAADAARVGAATAAVRVAADAAAADADAAAAWRAVRADADAIEAGTLPLTAPLWPKTTPDWFAPAWNEARDWLTANPGHDFWLRWYEAALAGRPLTGDWESHWQMLTEIALIPEVDWKKGAEHVAGVIEKIEEKYRLLDDDLEEVELVDEILAEAEQLAEALPLAESIEINPETGLFHAVPIPLQNPPLVGQVLARVQDALDDALQGNNGLNERSREARVITRVVTRFGNDPQRIEMDFTSVAVGLRRQFEVEDLPRTEDNLALYDAVEEGVRAIRATHPVVAENRRILAGQAMAEMGAEARALLEEGVQVLEAISDADLAEEFTEDSAEILVPRLPGARRFDPGGKAPALPGVTEADRLFSRVAKIALSKQLSDAIHKVDGSAAYKGARIVTTLAALVTLGGKLFGVF